MSDKISVLDIDIDNFTAKEAMKETVRFMDSDPVNIVELVTVDGLMQMDELPELKDDIRKFDLVLAGDKAILEAAEITDRKYLQETEGQVFLKMFFRYIHKNHKRIYLLVETEEEGEHFYSYLERCCSGSQIVGLAKVSAENRADDMLVNAINGGEVDCVISILSPPLQEEFIAKNRCVLNARIWLGLGKGILPVGGHGLSQNKITQFLLKRIFKKEIEKRKRNISAEPLSAK